MLIVGLADAYSTDLGGNKVMDGANIFSNLVQTFGTDNKGDGKAQANTSATSSTSKESSVTAKRINYSSTDVLRGNPSQVHTPAPKDTVVKAKDKNVVPALNTKDSLRAVQQTEAKNKLPIQY